jgi:hypothetical protein
MTAEPEREGWPMSVLNERIEAAFMDEYNRLKHEGFERVLEQRLDHLLYQVYRRGYIRGHSDRSREVQQEEERAFREGRMPMGVSIHYEGDRLILGGKDVTPPGRPARSDPPTPPDPPKPPGRRPLPDYYQPPP